MPGRMNSRRTLSIVTIGMVTLLSGCASIVSGTNQVVSVETRQQSAQVSGATCQLVNDKGTYYVTTPGTVTVRRSLQDMSVKCEKENSASGVAAVKSSTKAMAFGNLLFGGVIGAGVDIASGAAYDYPSVIEVMLGETVASPAPSSIQTLDEMVASNTGTTQKTLASTVVVPGTSASNEQEKK